MRLLSLAVFLLLLPLSALASGTVSFNLTWYATPGSPFVEEDFPVSPGVVIADFNRDGILDVAYTSPCISSCAALIVKFGTGGGNLGPDISYQWGASSLGELETADINGDGFLDLMVRDVLRNPLTLLLNNGDGTFQPFSLVFTGGAYSGSFTLGDFNHDGKIDLADIGCDAPNAGFPFGFASCTLYVYLGDNTGTFTQVQSIALKGPSSDLQSADINGDGNLDLVYVRNNSAVGVIRWGDGKGSFSNATYLYPATADPLDSVAIADFNNDSQLDVALLSGHPCHPTCGAGTPNTVWIYKNIGKNSFSLSSNTQFDSFGGAIVPADIDGDLNQDLIYYNPYSSGMYPVLQYSEGFDYALGLGKGNLGAQGILISNNGFEVATAFRDMDGDSRSDYAVIDWNASQLGIAIQTGGYKNCPPPSSANLAAAICGIKDGDIVTSPVLVKASGNSPAGVNQMQIWIDGKKQYVKWGDQLSKKFTLSPGSHRIAVVANDKYIGTTKTIVNVTVQ